METYITPICHEDKSTGCTSMLDCEAKPLDEERASLLDLFRLTMISPVDIICFKKPFALSPQGPKVSISNSTNMYFCVMEYFCVFCCSPPFQSPLQLSKPKPLGGKIPGYLHKLRPTPTRSVFVRDAPCVKTRVISY